MSPNPGRFCCSVQRLADSQFAAGVRAAPGKRVRCVDRAAPGSVDRLSAPPPVEGEGPFLPHVGPTPPRALKPAERNRIPGYTEKVAAYQVGEAHAHQVAAGGDADAVGLAIG